jgi:hypothetical protein
MEVLPAHISLVTWVRIMEIARLVLEYLKVLAWPLVVATGFLIFRRQLQALVATLQHIKLPGGAELDWQRQLQATEQAAEKVEATQAPQLPSGERPRAQLIQQIYDHGFLRSPSDYDFSYYRDIVERDPNLALAGLRMELERMLQNLTKVYHIDSPRLSPTRIASSLRANQVLTGEEHQLLVSIIEIATRAVHGQDVSKDAALRVIDSAEVFRDAYLAHMSRALEELK